MFVLMSYYFFCKDSARLAKSKVKVKKLLISFYECNPLLSAPIYILLLEVLCVAMVHSIFCKYKIKRRF